ncbi:MAG: SpoIVB peptidase [Lachnospirales bacterium]
MFLIIATIIIYSTSNFIFAKKITLNVGEEKVITTFSQGTIKNNGDLFSVKENPLIITGEKPGTVETNIEILGVPIKTVEISVKEPTMLIPVGKTLGIRINTEGVLVLGTGNVTNIDGKTINPAKDKVQTGDIIYKIDDVEVSSKEQLLEYIKNCTTSSVNLTISRNNEVSYVNVDVVKSLVDETNKIGIWVRDSTQGIGTMTYINPDTLEFGALGHGIIDVDTKGLMEVEEGYAYLSSVVSIKKGEKGSPGELVGEITIHDEVGKVQENNENGVFGVLSNYDNLIDVNEPIEVAEFDEILEGDAYILCSINGTVAKQYKVSIENLKENSKTDKNFIVKVIDEELLIETQGIVQGMSGSPIIQNNKLIGAITHVFVQDPTKGYGIYIKNMLNE